MEKTPKILILRWEAGHVPEGLMQLETMPGNSTNPLSYPFPVQMVHVKGANVQTVITHPSQAVLEDMIRIAKEMIDKENIKAVTTSCGFNAVFQKELAEALTVPVFTSALLQVPFVQCAIGYQRTVGIITANKSALTETHLRACGITADMKVEVLGLENAPEWSKIFDQPDKAFDIEVVSREIINVAKDGVKQFPDMGAIVLECTDLPPYAKRISEATGLPVFDFGSMMGHVAIALGDIDLY